MAEAHPHLLFANKYSEQHKSQMGANVSSTAALTETNQLKGDPNPAKSETVLVDDVITLPEIRHWTRWSDVKLATYLQPNHKWETTDKYRSQVKLLLDQNFDLVRSSSLSQVAKVFDNHYSPTVVFLSKGFAAIDFRNLVRQHIYDANIKGIGPDGQELKMTLKLLRNRRVVVKPLSEAQLDEQLAKELEWLKLSNSIPTIDQCQMQPRDVEKYFEEEKSRVVIRRCHRCKQHLAKEGGCNELICVCGAKICYICRFPSPDFQHWCQHPVTPGDISCTFVSCFKCPQFADSEDFDRKLLEEVESRQREVLMGKQEVKVVFESGWSQPKEPRRLRSHKTSIPAATVNRKLQSAEIEGSDISSGDSSLGAAASGSDVYALSETEDSEDS